MMESQHVKFKSKVSLAKLEVGEEMSSQPGANPSIKPDLASVPSPTKSKRKRKKKASKSTSVDANKSATPSTSGFSKVSLISGGGDLLTKPKPVAKLPSSREDSSSNWKALSEAQGKPLNTPLPASARNPKKALETPAKEDGEEHKQTGSAAEFQSGAKPKKKKTKTVDATFPVRKLPGEGLNSFGFYNYTHYGVLLTPIIPAHKEFILDTGILAMDSEMVGVGPMKESALARISIVNEFGYCLYDKFVKPKVEVTDYRTEFSGIREADLRHATPFETVGKEVSSIIKSHILVGHSLKHDFAVLYFTHPKARTRDTSDYFKKILHTKTPALRTLTKKILGVEIQQGEHSPIIDAQATMALYRICQKDWEHSVRQKNRGVDILKQTLDEFKANAVASPVP